ARSTVRGPRRGVGELRRQLVELRPLACGTLGIVEPVEGLALDVEEVFELLAQLGQRAAQVDVAIPPTHRLAELLQQVVEAENPDALELEALVEEPVEGLLHVVGERQELRQLVEGLLGAQPDLLGAVPGSVADDQHPDVLGPVGPATSVPILVELLVEMETLEDELDRGRHQPWTLERTQLRDGLAQARDLLYALPILRRRHAVGHLDAPAGL